MQRRILYIINPISGTGNKQSIRQLIEAKTAAAGIPYEIHPSNARGDYSALDGPIREKGFTDIVVAGGDGTVNQGIFGLKKHGLPFGILPCGSGNGLAFSAGIPKNHVKALDIVLSGRSEWADAFQINGRFACMLCGIGFDAQVAHDFALDKNRGLSTYVQKVFQHFFKAAPYPFEIHCNGRVQRLEAFFISIANSNQFGNNFTIAPKASLTDGLLDIVVLARQSKISLLLQTFRQVGGFNKLQQIELINDEASLTYFQTTGLSIKNPGLAPLHLDGEPLPAAASIEVKILPRSFQLIFPGKK